MLEQIIREFPFVKNYISHLPESCFLETRVSRLSLEALQIPVEFIFDNEVKKHSRIEGFNNIESDQLFVISLEFDSRMKNEVVRSIPMGDLLLRYLNFENYLWDDVNITILTKEISVPVWRRRKGTKKNKKIWVEKSFEMVIFKMPKNKTFRQLLAQYKKNRARMMA